MRKNFLIVGTFSLLLSLQSFARNPNGENAQYNLDRSQQRSSSYIKRGHLELHAGDFQPTTGAQGTYEARIDYDLNVIIKGQIKGSKTLQVPSEFFDPEFLNELRKNGESDQGTFKIKHLGYKDITTQSGVKYTNCDIVRIYDIKSGKSHQFEDFILETLGLISTTMFDTEESFKDLKGSDIKDVVLKLAIAEDVPVLGAVQLDLSAKVKGYSVKAGFDYLPPAPPIEPTSDVKQQ